MGGFILEYVFWGKLECMRGGEVRICVGGGRLEYMRKEVRTE